MIICSDEQKSESVIDRNYGWNFKFRNTLPTHNPYPPMFWIWPLRFQVGNNRQSVERYVEESIYEFWGD